MYVHWTKYIHTGCIAVNIGASAFDKWVLDSLKDSNQGLNGVTIRDVYDHVMGNYVKISQTKVDADLNTFNEPIDASLNLAV